MSESLFSAQPRSLSMVAGLVSTETRTSSWPRWGNCDVRWTSLCQRSVAVVFYTHMLSRCWFVKELSCLVGDSGGVMRVSELLLGHPWLRSDGQASLDVIMIHVTREVCSRKMTCCSCSAVRTWSVAGKWPVVCVLKGFVIEWQMPLFM